MLLGKGGRIRRRVQCFDRQACRRGMVAVHAVHRFRREACDDNVRPKPSHREDHIRKRIIVTPDAECLFIALGIPAISSMRKELPRAIDPTRFAQTVPTECAGTITELAATSLLSSLTA